MERVLPCYVCTAFAESMFTIPEAWPINFITPAELASCFVRAGHHFSVLSMQMRKCYVLNDLQQKVVSCSH